MSEELANAVSSLSRSIPPQWGSIRLRPLACTCAPRGVRVDGPTESRKNTHPEDITALVREQVSSVDNKTLLWARYASRAVQFHPQWGSIRFRLPPRTYDAPPWGCIVRVVELAKSREIPTRKILPLFFMIRPHRSPWPSWHGHETVPITDFNGMAQPWNTPTAAVLARTTAVV